MKDITKTIKVKSIVEGLKIGTNTKVNTPNYHPKTKKELCALIGKLIKKRGKNADLNDIDVSDITDMSSIFNSSEFNGDISKWDVSNVENMSYMFYHSEFNGDISNWDVSKVKNVTRMFHHSPLEDNPPRWYKKLRDAALDEKRNIEKQLKYENTERTYSRRS